MPVEIVVGPSADLTDPWPTAEIQPPIWRRLVRRRSRWRSSTTCCRQRSAGRTATSTCSRPAWLSDPRSRGRCLHGWQTMTAGRIVGHRLDVRRLPPSVPVWTTAADLSGLCGIGQTDHRVWIDTRLAGDDHEARGTRADAKRPAGRAEGRRL
jgi:hypothetical protein